MNRQCIFEGCHEIGEKGAISYRLDNYDSFHYTICICTTHRLWLENQGNIPLKNKSRIFIRISDD